MTLLSAYECNIIMVRLTRGEVTECTPTEVEVVNMAVNGIELPKELRQAKSNLYKYAKGKYHESN